MDRTPRFGARPRLVWLASVLMTGCLGSGDDRVSPSNAPDASSADGATAPPDGSNETIANAGDASVDAQMPNSDIDTGVDGPASACPILQTSPALAAAAHSAGFAGTDAQYYSLYDVACQNAADCVSSCTSAGGTASSCTSGSACVAHGTDGGMACLPPTYWLTTGGAFSESGSTTNAAQMILVENPYRDALDLSNFGVSIPDGATVTGIQFRVHRATLTGLAVDDSVQIIKNGTPAGINHAQMAAWPMMLDYGAYGGAYDTWGVTWTPADFRSAGFGISITPRYTGMAGNERAYIDSVRVTVFYTTPCE